MARLADLGGAAGERLDSLQDWLLDQRTAADPNIVFAVLDGFRALAEWMVNARSTTSCCG